MPQQPETLTKTHVWHVMQHQEVAIVGTDDRGPVTFRVGELREGICCMLCAKPLADDLSNQEEECQG